MTFDRLYQIVLSMSNQSWCRYWKMYNYPLNTEFAIQLRKIDGVPTKCTCLEEEEGFLRIDDKYIYVFIKEINDE